MTIYMSWLGGYKPSSSKNSVTESREARRKKLEAEQAERIKRAEARAKQRKLLQAAVQARQEADQAIKELCEIDPDIFVGESTASGDISSDILNDTDKEDQVVGWPKKHQMCRTFRDRCFSHVFYLVISENDQKVQKKCCLRVPNCTFGYGLIYLLISEQK